MDYEIDIESLRRDLMDYYGTAMFGVSGFAVMDLVNTERASDREIIEIALKNGIDLAKYVVDK